MEVERLDGLICGMWSSRSISAHNQITDIRALIGLLGGDFLSLTIERLLNLEADLRRLNLTGRAITAAKD